MDATLRMFAQICTVHLENKGEFVGEGGNINSGLQDPWKKRQRESGWIEQSRIVDTGRNNKLDNRGLKQSGVVHLIGQQPFEPRKSASRRIYSHKAKT